MKDLQLSFTQKLLLGISLSISAVFGAGSVVANRLIHDRLLDQAQQQIEVTNRGIQAVTRSLVLNAIKNYLKGLTETNLTYVAHVYARYKAGEISEKQAKRMAASFMLSQKVGSNGYLVALNCADSDHPTVAVHPNPLFVGSGPDRFPFMTEECRLKNGYFEFTLNASSDEKRPKSMWVTWFEPWKWTLGATPFRDEYSQLVDLNGIDSELAKVEMQGNGYLFIMDMQGKLLSHPTWRGRNMMDAVDSHTGTPIIRRAIDTIRLAQAQKMTEGLSGVIQYQMQEPGRPSHHNRMMSYRYVPEMNWIVGVVTDLDQIEASLALIRNILIGVMTISMLLAVFVVIWVVRPVTRSVGVLADAVDRIDGGNLDTLLPRFGDDELGRLSSAFNRMAKRLIRYTDDLECRVAERTFELEEVNRKLATLSNTDGLTGLANRRCFDYSLTREWARANRNGWSISLVMLDIDFFKRYNDRYGHRAGDECLKNIAEVLSAQTRRVGDVAARYGGEEFVLIFPDANASTSLHIAESVRQSIEAIDIPHELSSFGKVTASVGVASMPAGFGRGVEDLLRAADDALYRAKREGRNRIASAIS